MLLVEQDGHQLLEGRVSSALPDTAQGSLDLISACLNAGQCIGQSQAHVVVAVDGNSDIGPNPLPYIGNEASKFGGRRGARRIRDGYHRSPSLNRSLNQRSQIRMVTASGVFWCYRNVVYSLAPRVADCIDNLLDALVPGHSTLVLQVNIRSYSKDLKLKRRTFRNCLKSNIDISAVCATERVDLRSPHRLAEGFSNL